MADTVTGWPVRLQGVERLLGLRGGTLSQEEPGEGHDSLELAWNPAVGFTRQGRALSHNMRPS